MSRQQVASILLFESCAASIAPPVLYFIFLIVMHVVLHLIQDPEDQLYHIMMLYLDVLLDDMLHIQSQ